MTTFLLSGATGALGAALLEQDALRGHTVLCLVRSKQGATANSRIIRHADGVSVSIIPGDITLKHCGLSSQDINALAGTIDTVIHCAASVAFDDEHAAQRVNIDGTRHMLELSTRLGVLNFRYISTAYVGGSAPVFREEDGFVSQPRNAYEGSKRIAEGLVRSWAEGDPRRSFGIIRPSIIVGKCDGTSPTGAGFYTFFEPITVLAKKQCGRTADGVTNLPVAIYSSETSTLNLIPLDWTGKMVARLATMPDCWGVYHVVHPNPPKVRFVITEALAALRVTLLVLSPKEWESRARAVRGQVLLDRVMGLFGPYVTHGPEFGFGRAMAALGNQWVDPPPIDKELLSRLIRGAFPTTQS